MLKRLDSSPDGLSQAEAQKRLAQYGQNKIKEQKDIGGEICYTNSRH
jgi:magnesium-transporting ATPase (P-type)